MFCVLFVRIVNERVEPSVMFSRFPVPRGQLCTVLCLGTGKTTTLVQYTKMRPRTNFLNVVYNK